MSDNFNKDYAYYQGVLVLPKDFDEALLKKAYRREAMKWHPDKNPGDAYAEERLKLVNEAYEFFREVKNFKSQNQNSTKGYKNQYKQEDKSDFTPWTPKNDKNKAYIPTSGEIEFFKWFVMGFFVYIFYKIYAG